MSVVANVAVNLDARDAARQLSSLDDSVNKLNSSTKNLQGGMGGLSTAIAGLGLGALTQQLAGSGIDADRTAKRIKNLADANNETSQVFGLAAKAAKDFSISQLDAQKGVADLYGRLRPAGIALKDIETVYNGVNKAALAAGLTNADTSGVFLQLSQALGSGALQGDELRSIMEAMPAVGQAVAKVMGVTVGEVKKLGADGKITTDIMIKAAAELNKLAPPPADPFRQFEAALGDLRVELGENLLPLLTPIVQGLLGLVKAFGALPEPVQTLLVGALALLAAFTAIGGAIAILGPVIAALSGVGATIAGWLGIVGPATAAIIAALGAIATFATGTLLPALVAVFSGPVGWTILAVAAVVAMVIAFREPISKFLSWLGGALQTGLKVLLNLAYTLWVKPWVDLWNNVLRKPVTAAVNWLKSTWQGLSEFIPNAMRKAADFVRNIWTGAVNAVKNVIRGFLQSIVNNINTVIGLVNRLIRTFNRLPGPDIPLMSTLSVPSFANGGMVSKPTLAMVGDGGEPEYMVPQSKATQFAQEWLANTSSANGGMSTPQISITTGPVLEFDGKRYVSMDDLERAMRVTADGVIGRLRTPAARIALGMV
jgi:tape measure domain-containing protein